jgi:hypothetical protein
MKGKLGWKRSMGREGRAFGCETRDMDDIQMARSMRALAVELRAQDRARLKPDRQMSGRLRSAVREAEMLEGRMEDGGAALKRLVQDGRMMEDCARQAALQPF